MQPGQTPPEPSGWQRRRARWQDSVADRDRVGEALEPRRKPVELIVAEVTVAGAGPDNTGRASSSASNRRADGKVGVSPAVGF
jgi:hypothetical protein